MSLASVHDLFIVVVFHVVEQDLVEPGTRHRNGIMTRYQNGIIIGGK